MIIVHLLFWVGEIIHEILSWPTSKYEKEILLSQKGQCWEIFARIATRRETSNSRDPISRTEDDRF